MALAVQEGKTASVGIGIGEEDEVLSFYFLEVSLEMSDGTFIGSVCFGVGVLGSSEIGIEEVLSGNGLDIVSCTE